ncbi:MAG: hypothetical protein IPN22_14630 [Bacteroidetes bacterium]|nr:hypothetical protein [Bacteroidota bacterium]
MFQNTTPLLLLSFLLSAAFAETNLSLAEALAKQLVKATSAVPKTIRPM